MVNAKKIYNLVPLGLIVAFSTLLKLPSLFEPNHYGDEGIYQTIGQVIHRGGLLYRDVWDNKPPLLYLLYSFFDGDQFSVRLLSLIFALFSIAIFYFLARELFSKKPKITLLATFLFAIFFSLPLLEGNIANAENFMYLPILSAFYLVLKHFSKINPVIFLVSGLLLSIAFLFKIVALFDFGALIVFITITLWGERTKLIKILPPFFAGFILPVLLTAFLFLTQGLLREFLSATFSQNVSYVAWGNKFLIAQGWLILKIIILGLFCLLLLWKRKDITRAQLLIFLWLAFSLFNAFFAQRPWTHYLLVLVPSFCLLIGLFLQVSKFKLLTLVFILLTIYLAPTKFWLYDKTLPYYANFFSFIAGSKNLTEYRSFWGGHVDSDYRIAEFIMAKTAPSEPVFIWGNDAQIYALAHRQPASRYTVAYHMSFSPSAEEETIRDLLKIKPRYFIVQLPEAYPLRKLGILLKKNYHPSFSEEGFDVYERTY